MGVFGNDNGIQLVLLTTIAWNNPSRAKAVTSRSNCLIVSVYRFGCGRCHYDISARKNCWQRVKKVYPASFNLPTKVGSVGGMWWIVLKIVVRPPISSAIERALTHTHSISADTITTRIHWPATWWERSKWITKLCYICLHVYPLEWWQRGGGDMQAQKSQIGKLAFQSRVLGAMKNWLQLS